MSSAAENERFIETRGVVREYRVGPATVRALAGVDLQVRRGEFLAVLGVSGSGKSTLLHLLGGLDTPTRGEVWVDGRQTSTADGPPAGPLPAEDGGLRLPVVLPRAQPHGHGKRGPGADLPRHLRQRAGPAGRRGPRPASGLQHRAGHRPGQLSGGEQQRVAIARAVVHRPPLLLADEPTGNLDRATAAEVVTLLEKVHRELGTTVVMVTHDEEVVGRVAHRVVHLRDGRLLDQRGGRAMRVWKIVLLALGGLRRTPLRVTLTALGVAIACAALVSMVAFALGLQRQIETPMKLLSLLNDIHVFPKEGDAGQGCPRAGRCGRGPLAHLPGVSAAFPNIRVRGIKVRRGDHAESCLAVAMPREATMLGVAEEILVAGRFFSEVRRPEAILGAPLVHNLGFAAARDAVGQALTLEAGGLSADDRQVVHLPAARRWSVDRGGRVRHAHDRARPAPPRHHPAGGLDEGGARHPLRVGADAGSRPAAPPPTPVTAASPSACATRPTSRRWKSRSKPWAFKPAPCSAISTRCGPSFIFLRVLLAAVGTVALVVAALGIVNTLLMAVLERYQEIGICKAIGASDGDLVVLFLAEAGAIGLWGGLGGIVLGRAVSYGLEIAINVYARGQGATEPLDGLRLSAVALGRHGALRDGGEHRGGRLPRPAGRPDRPDWALRRG